MSSDAKTVRAVPQTIEEFIAWADSTPAVTWNGNSGVKDRYRQLLRENDAATAG